VERLEPKGFRQRQPDGHGGWLYHVQGVRRVLYRLPELLTAPPEAPVFVVEGEKDADRLARLGLVATTSSGGAGKWPPADDAAFHEPLRGRPLIVVPDHDPAGERHGWAVVEAVLPWAASVRLLRLPGLPPRGDVSDWLDTGDGAGVTGDEGAAAALLRLAAGLPGLSAADIPADFRRGAAADPAPTEPSPVTGAPAAGASPRPAIKRAVDLMARAFPPLLPVVEGLVYAGVSLLAGKPKQGKSWLALELALAVASGRPALGALPVRSGHVLLLALEGGEQRLQEQLGRLLGGAPPPDQLDYCEAWAPLAEGGLGDLRDWLDSVPAPRLIVIDTLKRVRAREERGRSLYAQDYEALAPLADLLQRYPGVTALVVHHTRKGESTDPLDLISGSTGLTGAVDGALVIQRSRTSTEATLTVVHRDAREDRTLTLRQPPDRPGWLFGGEAQAEPLAGLSPERRRLLDALRQAGRPLSPRELARATWPGPDAADAQAWERHWLNVRSRLSEMAAAGQIVKAGYGCYAVTNPGPPHPH